MTGEVAAGGEASPTIVAVGIVVGLGNVGVGDVVGHECYFLVFTVHLGLEIFR